MKEYTNQNHDISILRLSDNTLRIWTKNKLTDEQVGNLFYMVDYFQRTGGTFETIAKLIQKQEEKENAT